MPQGTGNNNDTQQKQVIDFNEARAQKLEEKRRKTERIFFKHLLSVYTVMGDTAMCPIDVVDVSEEGCSFQVPHNTSNPWPKTSDEMPFRLYFSQDTYLEIRMRVVNSRPYIDNTGRYVRYGCVVDKNTSSYPAFQQFVRFLKLYSEHAHKDTGNVTIFYL